jgi:hypothetical protein
VAMSASSAAEDGCEGQNAFPSRTSKKTASFSLGFRVQPHYPLP